MTALLHFDSYAPAEPDRAAVDAQYAALLAQADGNSLDALFAWDGLRRRAGSWLSVTQLRFRQDTRDAEVRAARDRANRLATWLEDRDAQVKRRLIDDPAVREEVGERTLAAWRMDLEAFDPAASTALDEEKDTAARYFELMGAAKVPFEGALRSLTGVGGLRGDPDRSRREAAARAKWGFFAEHRDSLDGIYDQLVGLRAGIARTLGHQDFIETAYRRRRRVDWGREDVASFRARIREQVVPLAASLRAEQRDALGVDTLQLWDEEVPGLQGAAVPRGDLLASAQEAFGALHPELGAFFEVMVERGLLDLPVRDAKAPGGFCTSFPEPRFPFIFANCNGSQDDVKVLVHEVGHAFQQWCSRSLPWIDQVRCSAEAAEVHSMSLEFLAWPALGAFFGDEADRFRRQHLVRALTFLPYGVAVDHFQHRVFEHPDASPADRHGFWQEMEATYLPWRSYGDLPHASEGGFWQGQRHIYIHPFYYVDYALAQTCALQLWQQSQGDHGGAMARYVELCGRGATEPFQAMVRSAGLRSPFDEGALGDVVNAAAAWLSK